MVNNKPLVGVFDSGVGGLTVLRALREQLPSVDFIYLGDTARVPYGTKTAASVTTYALQATRALVNRQVDYIVVACNTAASAALPRLQQEFPNIPIVGVIEPGARAACAASKSGRIGVIATESTINAGAYTRLIKSFWPEAETVSQACQLLVALAEEGWTEGPLVQAIIDHLINPLKENQIAEIDCLVLGCTHFPPFASLIQKTLGPQIALVDSASTTAKLVAQQLVEKNLLSEEDQSLGREVFLATDGKERFARVGSRFWHREIEVQEVEVVDL